MKRGDLINGFQYLIMLALKKHGSTGVGNVRTELMTATGETVTYGGVSATLTLLERNGDVLRTFSKPKSGKVTARKVFHFKLTDGGADRLEKMNAAVWALMPVDASTCDG
jgi:hypothetical protein